MIQAVNSIQFQYFAFSLEEAVGPFIGMIIFIGIIAALMLPVLAIPYIFMKMGSMAAKIQSIGGGIAKGLAKDRYKKSAVGRELAARKNAREAVKNQRYIEGRGLSGRTGKRVRGVLAGGARTQVGKETSRMVNEQMRVAREKIETDRLNVTAKNMSLAVAGGIGTHSIAEMQRISADTSDKRFKSEEDKASLDYLSRAGANSALLAQAAVKVKASADDMGTGADMEKLVNFVKSSDGSNYDLSQLSKGIRDAALETKRKDLAYGDVVDGKYVQYKGKTPEQVVGSGIAGINKDSLKDPELVAAIRDKAARGSDDRMQIIQQTIHIDKTETLYGDPLKGTTGLAGDLGIPAALLQQARQSLKSGGTIEMPTGI